MKDHDLSSSFKEGKKINYANQNIYLKFGKENIGTNLDYVYKLCLDIFELYQKSNKSIENTNFQIICQEYEKSLQSYNQLLKIRRNDRIDKESIKKNIIDSVKTYQEIFEEILKNQTNDSIKILQNISTEIKTLIKIESQ